MDLNILNIQSQAQGHKQAQALSQTQSPAPKSDFEKKAWDTATKFEAVFLSQILKSMSIGLKTDGPFSGGQSEEIFRDVLNEEMSSQIARSGGIGLSDSIYREILKTQEVGY